MSAPRAALGWLLALLSAASCGVMARFVVGASHAPPLARASVQVGLFGATLGLGAAAALLGPVRPRLIAFSAVAVSLALAALASLQV